MNPELVPAAHPAALDRIARYSRARRGALGAAIIGQLVSARMREIDQGALARMDGDCWRQSGSAAPLEPLIS